LEKIEKRTTKRLKPLIGLMEKTEE